MFCDEFFILKDYMLIGFNTTNRHIRNLVGYGGEIWTYKNFGQSILRGYNVIPNIYRHL